MTIGWLIYGDDSYGVRRATTNFIRYFDGRGHTNIVLSMSRGRFSDELVREGIDVVELGLPSVPGYRQGLAAYRAHLSILYHLYRGPLRSLEKVASVDIVYVRHSNLAAAGGVLGKRFNVPCVWHLSNVIGASTSARMYRTMCRALSITPVGNSLFTCDSLGMSRCEVVPIGVSQKSLPKSEVYRARSALGIPGFKDVFVISARLSPIKGQAIAIQALNTLVSRHPNIHLLLVGGDNGTGYAEQLKSMVYDAGLQSHVTFTGFRDDVSLFYGMSDVLVSATTVAESFGISVVEGMMNGLPALVHALGGPRETVVDSVTGWHYQPASSDAVACAFNRAISDRDRWTQMGDAARRHSHSHYSVASSSRRLECLLQDRISIHGGGDSVGLLGDGSAVVPGV